ncbi:hypothetical protein [Cellulophaga sp. BC115SP]|uniref:hypothetical protein n=1 Tax=Cellulophaga sp. BC115SP TaxID=2683263 RepID=UPI001411C5CF|nr:hypothetical protein [Cellulophaga sp. BC115SP]NBB31862.1 hypothetical protein [Cellulophaga sp. BC115SP]
MTEDDVIEHLLMRLNTDFVQCCLDVRGFCETPSNHDLIDRKMVKKVISKMYEHDVAMPCTGDDQPIETIEVTTKGIKVYENGGWKKYLLEFEKLNQENDNKAIQEQNIIITGSVYGSNVGHGDFSQSRIDFKDQPPINPISQPIKKSGNSSEIWDKIKHISAIVGGIGAIVAAITKLMDLW